MARFFALVMLTLAAAAQSAPPLAGGWALNRALSEFPKEIGFNPAWMTAATAEAQASGSGSGRGRRGSSGGGSAAATPFSARPESYEDARRVQILTTEVRTPPARLTIADTMSAVTITNEMGQSRTVHPDGRNESIEIQGVPFIVTARRERDDLLVTYRVDVDREVRYTYAPSTSPAQLVVDVQFFDHGAGDKARRVYEPGSAAVATSAGHTTADAVDQRPGAEMKGLTNLGILVEDLSAPSIACGLNHDALENSLARRLTDGGFTVRRNFDEDTYVYVNIMTTSANGLCVSRYDAFLYTHATAKVSYHDQPVLVQVSLMHRGGIGSSAAAGHDTAVARGLQGFVDIFVTSIKDANK